MARKLGWAARWKRALPAAIVFGWASFGAPDGALAQGRDEFRKGIDLFEQGKYAEAREQFEIVLAANPSAEVALEMRNEAGYQIFVEMLARKDDFATIARKLLELAERGAARERLDEEKIRALKDRMFSDDEEASYRAIEELASQVGPFVVPHMIEHLGERHDNQKRVRAIVLLSKLGPDGTNAIIPLLKHGDDFVRQNAAAILGHIRDLKAIPYLKAVAEKRGESAHVQKEALLALKNITGKEGGSLDPAAVYFHALAERYYQEDPSVMINNFRDWTAWSLKDDKLSFRIVPKYAWNEELAEDACYAAVEHAGEADMKEADLDAIYTTLVSVFFQAAVEAQEILAVAEDKAAAGIALEGADVDELKAAVGKTGALPVLALARGESQILKALRKALKDRRVAVAVAMIEALRDIRMSEGLLPGDGASLSGYLEDPSSSAPRAKLETAPPPAVEPARPAPAAATEQPTPQPAAQPGDEKKPAEPAKPEDKKEDEPAPPQPRRRRVSAGPRDGVEGFAALEQPGSPAGAAGWGGVPFGEPETLATLDGSGEAHGAALAAALTYDDKRVRYAAAEALLRLAPTRKFANAPKVVENLAAALGESGSRVVLIAARDIQVRNRLTGLVRQLGHLPFAVETAKEAIVRARSSPAEDVIILHTETNAAGDAGDFTPAQFLEQVEVDYRTKGTPVILATPKKGMEDREKLYADKVKSVLPDDVDPVILKDKIDALFAGGAEQRKRDPKARAVEAAKQAAEALAACDPRTPVFDLRGAIPALMQAVEVQPDAVRAPALRALGVLRARESVDKVAAIFDNAQNAKEVRVAAAFALGEALRGAQAPSRVFESLKAALKEGDADLFRASSEALGKIALTRDQARAVLVEQRVE